MSLFPFILSLAIVARFGSALWSRISIPSLYLLAMSPSVPRSEDRRTLNFKILAALTHLTCSPLSLLLLQAIILALDSIYYSHFNQQKHNQPAYLSTSLEFPHIHHQQRKEKEQRNPPSVVAKEPWISNEAPLPSSSPPTNPSSTPANATTPITRPVPSLSRSGSAPYASAWTSAAAAAAIPPTAAASEATAIAATSATTAATRSKTTRPS